MQSFTHELENEKNSLIGRLRSHSFLQRCREGNISLGELKLFLLQQGLYSRNFTKYLCAAMSNLPSNAEIRILAKNLFEELGLDARHCRPHHEIYQDMLARFSLHLENAQPLPGTVTLINAMLTQCRNPNPSFGLGALCLGAEALVPALYGDIVAGFLSRGIAKEDLEFFTLHIGCDEEHAAAMSGVMASLAAQAPGETANMAAAGRELVEARLSFFTSIEEASSLAKIAV